MNIAFFVTRFPTISETFIINQIIALKKSGHAVHIYAAQKPVGSVIHQNVIQEGLLKNTFYLDDIPPSRIGKIKSLLGKLICNPTFKNIGTTYNAAFKNKSKLSVYELIHYIGKPEYDVLHAHFGPNGNYVTELLKLGIYPKAKFVTTFHGYDLNPAFKENKIYENLFACCKCYTVNTNYSRKQLLNLGVRNNYIHVMPVGLDIKRFQKKNNEKVTTNEIRLIFIGRLVKLKGPDRFIEICHKLDSASKVAFSARIIGEGDMENELKLLLKKYNLNDKVILCGSLTKEETINYLQQADLFIMPGIYDNARAEAQGLVIQEAQAMELPVLVSDVGGMPEGVVDGVTGFVLPENDLKSFAEKIKWFSETPEKIREMGRAGRNFVEEKYDINLLNEKLIDYYKSCKTLKV